MPGPTFTALPVRLQVERDCTIAELLRRTQKEATEAIPFEHLGLQNISKLSDDAETACAFQTLLLVQPAAGKELSDSLGLRNFAQRGTGDFNAYAIMMECQLSDDSIDVIANFDNRAIDQRQMKRVVNTFCRVVDAISTRRLDRQLRDLHVTTAEDIQELWNNNSRLPEHVESCLHELFVEQARPHAGDPAICGWDGSLSYGALDKISTQLAQYLVQEGVISGDFVPFCFEKSTWAIVSILAIMKAGGACVALDPSHPESRRTEIMHMANAKFVLTSLQHRQLFRLQDRAVVVHEDFLATLPDDADIKLPSVSARQPAFVAWTSGSSGTPKGVVQEHAAICTNIIHHERAMRMSRASRVLQFAAYTFDPSLGDIFATFIKGGCLCVISEHQRKNDLKGAINAMNVNQACLTPTAVSHLRPTDVPCLKTLSLGGEVPSQDLIKRWATDVFLINIWGVTECTTWSTCNAGVLPDAKPGNIGKPLGCACWITDLDCRSLSPVGAVGELVVEGTTLAQGYLADKEKTMAAFIEDPDWLWNKGNGRHGRVYRTGDLARYDQDGNIIYLGRHDAQVKLRGNRIELGEIESRMNKYLNQMPKSTSIGNIEAAACLVRLADRQNTPMLAAFLSIAEDAETTDDLNSIIIGVTTYLQEHLPSVMVPSFFITLGAIPLTASGKIDRRTLQGKANKTSISDVHLPGPSIGTKQAKTTAAEEGMAKLWAHVLDIEDDDIGANDNFFRLGGDSMSAMKMVFLAQESNISITAQDVFEKPRLSDLARVSRTICRETEVARFSLLGPPVVAADVCNEAVCQCTVSENTI